MTTSPPTPPSPPKTRLATGIIKPTGKSFTQRTHEIDAAKRRHLEPAELSALWKALAPDPFWTGYFRLQYHFGCRSSEVAILLKEDVSFTDKQVVIRRLKKSRLDKLTPDGYETTTYPITDNLLKVLKNVPHYNEDNPWFFESRYRAQKSDTRAERMASIRINGQWRAVSRTAAQLAFIKAAKEAGIPEKLHHTHVLRHTRATLLFAKNVSESHVQYLLGHSNVETTRHYISVAESLKKSVAEILEHEDD